MVEASEAAEWYATRDLDVAQAFLNELDRAILMITDAPATCASHLYGTRRLVLRRFPYAVVLLEKPHKVIIVAITHQKRKPGYWRSRSRTVK